MNFFDTHCHLDFSVFDLNRDDVLASCLRAGVKRLLLPGVARSNWQRILKLSKSEGQLYAALGMHPCFMSEHQLGDLEELKKLISQGGVVALGEIGLDFWDPAANKENQLELFESQLELAKDFELPVILHSRKSHDVLLTRLRKKHITHGVLHGFSGSWQQAKGFVEQGIKLGLGGAITYPRASKLRDIVRQLPIESIVLETDSPDMPLCGKQGQVNRPDYLPEVFDVLCQLRDESRQALADQLWENSHELFRQMV